MRTLIALTAAFAAAACGSSASSPTPDLGLVSPDASGPDASFDAGTLTATGTVTAAHRDANGNTVPIAGARVCIDGHPEVGCGVSTGDGSYAMRVPVSVQELPQLAFVTTVDGWLGEVNHYVEGDAGFTSPWPLLLSDAEATTYLATDAGFTYVAPDTTDGFVSLTIYGAGPTLAGATATIMPATAKGAVYEDPDGTPDPGLAATSSNGIVLFGNVPPGPFTITVSAPGKTCSFGNYLGDWPAPTNQIIGIVAAGAVSDNLSIDCM